MSKINELVQKIEDKSLREELQQEVLRLKNRKKFGLVWEDKSEKVATDCEKHLPILREIDSLAIESSDSLSTNIIIEGDNYHALSVLNYTHFGAVDVIYIDPPYNTGAKNWRYNNSYVDENDSFKHSKWISFMDKRLRLAKNLLADDGVIIMTIDDYEIENSILLLNEIFGESNHLGTIVIKNNPQGRSSPTGFQISHEYALFYGKSVKKIGTVPRSKQQLARYNERDSIGPFEWRNFRAQYSQESDSMRYPIYIKKDCSDFRIPKLEWDSQQGKFIALEEALSDGIISLPIDEKGRMRTWKWGIDTTLECKADHMGVRLDRSGTPAVY